MNVDGDDNKDFRELNYCLRDGDQKDKDKVVSKEQGLLEEDDELKVNEISKEVKDWRGGGDPLAPALLQMQPQTAMVCWERFLHLRSLKVLLVENDDSTRHVVTAFLRNCSYEVVEAANALQAWKVLEDLTNHIDLILTEVVMPCLSGTGLLCKIMSHKTRKNIPVIMMSSHDSMGLVFKCLSKGAVDFLVKPIRKNELKNLWQHVWRRCQSSSGSGSESGTQSQKSVKSKSVEKSDNNTGSNDEDDNGSSGMNAGDGSDDGSGTQSSWTKLAVEVESPQQVSPCYRVSERPDSTCAQVIHSNAEISGNKWVPVTTSRECQEQKEQLDNVAMGKDLEIGMSRNLDLQLECPIEVPIKLVGSKQNVLEMGFSKLNEQMDKGQLDLNSESPSSKLKYEVANLTGIIASSVDRQVDSTEYEAPNRCFKLSDINNKALNDIKEPPSLELRLKRLRGVKDTATSVQDDRNVLRRSDSSAFSRYNTGSNANKAPSGNIGTTSQLDSRLERTKKGSVSDIRSHLSVAPNQCSNGGSNNIDMASTTNDAFKKPVVLKNKSAATSTIKCLNQSSAFQPLNNDLLCAPQQVVLDKAGELGATTVLAQPRGTQQELQIQHFPHHYDRHHLVHNMKQQQLPAAAPHCGSSNVLGKPVKGNAGHCSVNGSASGSNIGSNGQDGGRTGVNTGGMNIESDNGIAGKSGSGDASGSGSGSGSGIGSGNRVNQSKFAQREAALIKFRQKRKERCFRKKVRYHSRKRLAEQRPRVQGQFVRQTANKNTSSATDS